MQLLAFEICRSSQISDSHPLVGPEMCSVALQFIGLSYIVSFMHDFINISIGHYKLLVTESIHIYMCKYLCIFIQYKQFLIYQSISLVFSIFKELRLER